MNMSTFKRIRNILMVIIFIAFACGATGLGVAIIFIGLGGLLCFKLFAEPMMVIYELVKEKIEDKQIIKEVQNEAAFSKALSVLNDNKKSATEKQKAISILVECANKGYKPAKVLLAKMKSK